MNKVRMNLHLDEATYRYISEQADQRGMSHAAVMDNIVSRARTGQKDETSGLGSKLDALINRVEGINNRLDGLIQLLQQR